MDRERNIFDYEEDPTKGTENITSNNVSPKPALQQARPMPARQFYGQIPQSKGAQNLNQQMAMTPAGGINLMTQLSSGERAAARGQSSTTQRRSLFRDLNDPPRVGHAKLLQSPNTHISARNNSFNNSNVSNTSNEHLSLVNNSDVCNKGTIGKDKLDKTMNYITDRQQTFFQTLGPSRSKTLAPSRSRRILDNVNPKRQEGYLMPTPKPKRLPFADDFSQSCIPRESIIKFEDQILESVQPDGLNNDKHSNTQHIGFPNKGLTCYMNATLQALLAQPSFMRQLLSLERRIKRWPSSEGLLQPLCKLARWKAAAKPVKIDQTLSTFLKKLVEVHPQFEGMHNQDAHEFLVILCDAIHEQCMNYAKLVAPEKESLEERENPALPIQTLISKDFSFELKETKTCHFCNHKREEITSNYIFKLVIPPHGSTQENLSLDTLILKTLNSSAHLACSSCIDAKKRLGFDQVDDTPHQLRDVFVRLPKYLIIYCPRIEIYNVPSEVENAQSKVRFRKNQIPIEISDSLSMLPFIDDNEAKNSQFYDHCDDWLHEGKPKKRSLSRQSSDESSPKKSKSSLSLSPTANQTHCSVSNTPPNFRQRITSSPVNSPKLMQLKEYGCTTPDPSPIKAITNSSPNSYNPHSPTTTIEVCETPEKLKNLTGDQVANLSEADQLAFAMKESLKCQSFVNSTSRLGNVLELTEEEQLARAINASLLENSVSEEQQLLAAIEESNKCSKINLKSDHFKENAVPFKTGYMVSQRGDGDLNHLQENNENKSGNLGPQVDLNEDDLTTQSEIMEFRDVFADEMKKETEDAPIDSKLVQTDGVKFQYHLSSIITHLGSSSTQCGHYVADVFSPEENMWYRYNDMKVAQRTLKDVLEASNKNGYIFIYSTEEK